MRVLLIPTARATFAVEVAAERAAAARALLTELGAEVVGPTELVMNDDAEGLPVLRPLALEYPDDPVCVGIDDQYLLGADLLVVPIFDDGLDPVERRFYLPAGQWRDWFTGEVFDGPGYFTRTVGLATIPLLVRVGAVIPVLSVDAGVQSTADLLGRPWRPADAGADQPVEMVGFDGTPLYIGSVKGVR